MALVMANLHMYCTLCYVRIWSAQLTASNSYILDVIADPVFIFDTLLEATEDKSNKNSYSITAICSKVLEMTSSYANIFLF